MLEPLRGVAHEQAPGPKMVQNKGPEEERALIKYLWDNYIEQVMRCSTWLLG